MSSPRSSLGLGSLLVAVVIVLALGVGSVYAAIPNGNGTYYACRVTNTGSVRLINYPKVNSCPAGREAHQVERPGSGRVGGRSGPKGDQGPQGPRDRLAQPTGTPSPTSLLASLMASTTRARSATSAASSSPRPRRWRRGPTRPSSPSAGRRATRSCGASSRPTRVPEPTSSLLTERLERAADGNFTYYLTVKNDGNVASGYKLRYVAFNSGIAVAKKASPNWLKDVGVKRVKRSR